MGSFMCKLRLLTANEFKIIKLNKELIKYNGII